MSKAEKNIGAEGEPQPEPVPAPTPTSADTASDAPAGTAAVGGDADNLDLKKLLADARKSVGGGGTD